MRSKEHGKAGRGSCPGVVQEVADLFVPLLPSHVSKTSGFHDFKCPLCHDYKVRAGIRVSATSVGFNCFNCGQKSMYADGDCTIPKRMVELHTALGGDPHSMNMLKIKLMGRERGEGTSEVQVDGVNTFRAPPKLTLPRDFTTLERGLQRGEPQAIAVAKYLVKRELYVDPSRVYVAITTNVRNPWLNRAIIPTYMWGNIVSISGRDITDTSPKKYHTDGAKGKAIYNFDTINKHPARPLFITEGQFDAMRIDGVAVMGNTVTPHQVHWLSTCTRRKIVVPDKGRSGVGLALQALDLGWEVALPDFGSTNDVDAAVARYGKLYCLEQLLTTITSGDVARTMVELYCRGS